MLSYQDTVAEKDKIWAIQMYSGFQHESGTTASAGHAFRSANSHVRAPHPTYSIRISGGVLSFLF